MKLQALAFSALALVFAGTASASDGPFSYYSNGTTQPIIQQDAQGNITYVGCTNGSRCVLKTASTTFSGNQTQYSSFTFTTGAAVSADHYAFGVRGNSTNGACTFGQNVPPASFPFLGRGFIIYPSSGEVKFENYTQNCKSGNGVVGGTSRPISFRPNTTYYITLWANDTNTGYSVEKLYYNRYDRSWDFMPVASGNCLSQASAAEAFKCSRTAYNEDQSTQTNRAFITSTDDRVWSVQNWYLDKY